MEKLIVLDCEVYPNYFLAAFKNIHTGKTLTIEARDGTLAIDQRKKLHAAMMTRNTFGFNSNNYDLPVIAAAIDGYTTQKLTQLSDHIITESSPGWMTMRHFDLPGHAYDHFDIKEAAPGVMISLKLYGGRMHSEKLQDLPIEPGTILTEPQMEEIKTYCINDLDTTIDLYNSIKDQIDLRVKMSLEYDQDLRSKSDAQIAEAVLKSKHKVSRPDVNLDKKFRYETPHFIKFQSQQLQDALNIIEDHRFELDGRGSVKLPPELSKMKIDIGETTYKLGIGGLHSQEKGQTVIPKAGEILADRDVESYYPNIILNCNLYPPQFGKGFLQTYRDIVDTRLHAKWAGDKITANALKIVVNGSFGKLGSKWSVLYAPGLMLAVTVTGQLSLLMLIERLEAAGISVVSANTDGFVSLIPDGHYQLYDDICFDWELDTNFGLEETRYKALYSRDVNNYLAVMENGAKGKGVFTNPGLMKNPQANICIEAVKAYLIAGTPINQTVRRCDDITKFIMVRRVTGGAQWRGEYLGKVVRWYWSTKGEKITYKKNGNKVATSDGARPLMTLDKYPVDIDYAKYEEEAQKILKTLGAYNGTA